MIENLPAIFAKYAALDPVHKAAVSMWVGSWAARTSLWPMALMEVRRRMETGGGVMSLSQCFANAAPTFKHYVLPWVILKTTQWGSMGYLGSEFIRSFIPVKSI